MNIKWQKNAHILIKSSHSYLKADEDYNIRRASFLGYRWFQFADWLTNGRQTEQLNRAVDKTLLIIRAEIKEIQLLLSDELQKLSKDEVEDYIKNFDLCSQEIKSQITKIQMIIQRLILKGKTKVFLYNIPNNGCCIETLRDLPQHIREKTQQMSEENQTHFVLDEIEKFFEFDFIIEDSHRFFVRNEVEAQSSEWVY